MALSRTVLKYFLKSTYTDSGMEEGEGDRLEMRFWR